MKSHHRHINATDSPLELYYAIANSKLIMPYKILAYCLYLSAARVTEVLKMNSGDIRRIIKTDSGMTKEYIIFRKIALKNRKHPTINVPILIGENEYETKMAEAILKYKEGVPEEGLLFPFINRRKFGVYLNRKAKIYAKFKEKNGEDIFKETGIHPHFLRHCRLMHLVNIYKMREYQITAIAGWASPITATHYIKLDWENYIPQQENIYRNIHYSSPLKQRSTQ